MLGVFLFSQFLAIKTIDFSKQCCYPHEDIDYLKSNLKRYITYKHFLPSSGFLKKMPIWKYAGLSYARFEDFVHNAESVTRTKYAWRIIAHNTIDPN